MNWTELLKSSIEENYKATEGLFDFVDGENLDWKPETGQNWMNVGQLLLHITSACGAAFKGFATGDWGLPEGVSAEDMSPGDMLPPAEKMPSVSSVEEARHLLAQDKALALDVLETMGEETLATKPTTAPWDPQPMVLGRRLLGMAMHLGNHKAQLFYYLKLQGKPVNTMHMYGMTL